MEAVPNLPPVIIGTPTAEVTPVAAAERMPTLDALRGVALFGILTVNMAGFSWPADLMMPGQRFGESA